MTAPTPSAGRGLGPVASEGHDDAAPDDASAAPRVRFPFRFSLPFLVAALPFGIVPARARVDVDDEHLEVRYGPWSVHTPIANVRRVSVTGPYAWPKVIGPPHLSLADGGVTFGSNTEAGVCIAFREPVPVLLPVGILRHRALTVTVAEPQRLAELLDVAAGEPGDADLEEIVDDVHRSLLAQTTRELRQRARDLGVSGASRMKKADLVAALTPTDPEPPDPDDRAA